VRGESARPAGRSLALLFGDFADVTSVGGGVRRARSSCRECARPAALSILGGRARLTGRLASPDPIGAHSSSCQILSRKGDP
jgi:hypothetical protein